MEICNASAPTQLSQLTPNSNSEYLSSVNGTDNTVEVPPKMLFNNSEQGRPKATDLWYFATLLAK